MQRPLPNEYRPYFQRYIDLVEDGNFIEIFKKSTTDAIRFFENIPLGMHNYRYAENKWTVREVLMHIIDTERVFSYRVLVASRGDSVTELPSVDENLYAKNVDVSGRSMESLLKEFELVREGAEMLFENMTDVQSKFEGNGVTHPITARAAGYIMVGHTNHHIQVIREKYLN